MDTSEPASTAVAIDPFELRSPRRLIGRVARTVPLRAGDAYAVLVRDPSRAQRVVAIDRLPQGAGLDVDAPRELRAAQRFVADLSDRWELLVGGRCRPSETKIVTVVVREGLCVWGPAEWAWSSVWRYASSSLSGGDLITVTEHGWYDLMTGHADHRPAAVRP